MPIAYVIETCLMAYTTGTWCVDTGATNHVCNSLQEFQKTRRLANGEIYLWLGDTSRVAAKAVGEVSLHFGGHKVLVLKGLRQRHKHDIDLAFTINFGSQDL